MKILIISTYDSLVYYSVYDNGRILEKDDLQKIKKWSFIRDTWWHGFEIPENILKQYDKIYLCNCGEIEIMK